MNTLAQLKAAYSPKTLFAEPPRIDFACELEASPCCEAALKVSKSRKRERVVSLHLGPFEAIETVKRCSNCRTQYGSKELQSLVPSGSNFAYDVMVHVGMAMFVRHRNESEIVAELASRNVAISSSEVGWLGRRFVLYLAEAHEKAADRLKGAMALNGGYVLHLDGTGHSYGSVLMSSIDELTNVVLLNRKVPSEKKDEIVPFLRQIQGLFGDPLALVHDMGVGIISAVGEVFPGLPDFICHFHFLRDIGKDLLGHDYDQIRNRLRKHGISGKLHQRASKLRERIDETPESLDVFCQAVEADQPPAEHLDLLPRLSVYGLVLWALDGKRQGCGYGFPFDRPHLVFAQRLRQIEARLQELTRLDQQTGWKDNKAYFQLLGDLRPVLDDRTLWKAVENFNSDAEVFDGLREAMMIAPVDGCKGLNDNGDDAPMKTIRERVERFREGLLQDPRSSADNRYDKMIGQLNEYWEKLFCDPLRVQKPEGEILVQVQRTNNLLEGFFRDRQQADRRRTGHKSFGRTLKTMLGDTPLVKNLENPNYLKILTDGKESLEECFASIDAKVVRARLKREQSDPDRVPRRLKKLLAEPGLLERIASITMKSNRILAQ